jgi:hypothetical protein
MCGTIESVLSDIVGKYHVIRSSPEPTETLGSASEVEGSFAEINHVLGLLAAMNAQQTVDLVATLHHSSSMPPSMKRAQGEKGCCPSQAGGREREGGQ